MKVAAQAAARPLALPAESARSVIEHATPLDDRAPWRWIVTLYFAMGIPATVAGTVSAVLFNRLGVPNQEVAFYTGTLMLPWLLKPLWSPLLEVVETKKFFIVTTELLVAFGLAGIAASLSSEGRVGLCLFFLALIAVSAATHDIAADGMYLCALSADRQARYVGLLGVAFHAARLTTQGLLVVLAGSLEVRVGILAAWQFAFAGLAVITAALAIHHARRLPLEETKHRPDSLATVAEASSDVVKSFFRRTNIVGLLAVVVLYRVAEGQLLRIAPLFLIDPGAQGGLGLSTVQVGVFYGGLGVCSFIGGALLGGHLASRLNDRTSLVWMCVAFHMPGLMYLLLASMRPESLVVIAITIALEQLLYGIGSIGLKLMMMRSASDGPYRAAHFSFVAGLSGAAPAAAGMLSGSLQSQLGYTGLFVWIVIGSVPVVIVAYLYARSVPRRDLIPA